MLGPIKPVGIYVEDQERSVEFYVKQLGFEVRRRMPMGADAEWIEVAPPGVETCLVVYPRSLMPDWAERKSSIVYHCPDIEATMDQIAQRGVTIAMELGNLPWGKFAAIEDLDGNWSGLTDMPLASRPE